MGELISVGIFTGSGLWMLALVSGVSRLRASGHTHLAYVPIIALTAHGKKEEIEKALESGCDVCISKPIGMRELVARVEAYLSTGCIDKDTLME